MAATYLELVRDFLNTPGVEAETDELTIWLRDHGLGGADDRASDDDLATALAPREGLRAATARPYCPTCRSGSRSRESPAWSRWRAVSEARRRGSRRTPRSRGGSG
ncbi:hypothetical protein ACIBHX_33560 [Nonomuraea sp. NPDC050536]|uniref:hypothetical protein n=1 Tax=Nonomuraea sp. NPDC050536 TaxID=3364366 RepID=UPI0037CC7DB0